MLVEHTVGVDAPLKFLIKYEYIDDGFFATLITPCGLLHSSSELLTVPS